MERKIWKSGSSYVVPVPSKWLRKIRERRRSAESIMVYIKEIDESTIQVSTKEEASDILSFDSSEDDPVKMETWIYGAYMEGRDVVKVSIPLKHAESRKVIDRIPSLLYGATKYASSDVEKFTLEFDDNVIKNKKILVLLEECYEKISQMYERNHSSMESFPDSRILEEAKMLIDTFEPELDKTSFYLKRLLNKSLFDPKLFNELELSHRKHIVPYCTIVSNIERIGDLHEEISRILDQLREVCDRDKLDLKLKPMGRYLGVCHQSVDSAFNILKNDRISKLLKSRHDSVDVETGIGFIPGIYEKAEARDLATYIDTSPLQCVRFLTLLQSRAWGIRGNSVNAIEAKLNMLH